MTSLQLPVAWKTTSQTLDLTYMLYYFKIEYVMHGRCSTVNINSDNHNSDVKEDVMCSFSNLLKSTNFVCFVKNTIVLMNVNTPRKSILLKK